MRESPVTLSGATVMKGYRCEGVIAKILTDPKGNYQMVIHARGRDTRMPEPPLPLREVGSVCYRVRGRGRPKRAYAEAVHSNGDPHLLDALRYPR
jgi:hypothetical protein